MAVSDILKFQSSANVPNYAPYYIIFHFFFAYVILSTRAAKNYLKLDHNISPREDLAKYGDKAISAGKLTQRQLNFLKRNEACHANSMEHFPLFVAATIFATVAGIDAGDLNAGCATYTASRVVFATAYLAIEKNHRLSYIRSLAWWASNIACLRMLYAAGRALNAES